MDKALSEATGQLEQTRNSLGEALTKLSETESSLQTARDELATKVKEHEAQVEVFDWTHLFEITLACMFCELIC